jgi:outer membrane protein W
MVLPAFASAQFEAGNWELSLSGGGSVNNGTTADQISGTAEVGYFVTKELEVGVRQQLSHQSEQDADKQFSTTVDSAGNLASVTQQKGEGWVGTSAAAVDYHFDLGKFQPFIGAFGGYQYNNLDSKEFLPDGTSKKIHDSSWIAGPEAGLKYFVNGTTFVFVRVGYDYWFENNDDSFFAVDFGVGFRF